MILFDASAILNLSRKDRGNVLLDGCTLDLAGYEVGNAIRRLVDVEKALPRAQGAEILTLLQSTVGGMERAKVSSLVSVFENAIKEALTFYDASYLTAAVEGGYRLVTDDEELLQAASKYLDASRSSDLA
jgi:predicted nucleic acid-binding protein